LYFFVSALAISAAYLSAEFLKIDHKHQRTVKGSFNGVEPMALGLSVNQDFRSVLPEGLMRSDLVFDAMTNVPNRYLLCQIASKAARKLHKPGAHMRDTTNDVLAHFSHSNPIGFEPASRKLLAGPSRHQITLSVIPLKSEVIIVPPGNQRLSASWEAERVPGA
jgi:hypothetical protein